MAFLLFPEQSDSDVLTINDVSCGNGIRADGASARMWQRSCGAWNTRLNIAHIRRAWKRPSVPSVWGCLFIVRYQAIPRLCRGNWKIAPKLELTVLPDDRLRWQAWYPAHAIAGSAAHIGCFVMPSGISVAYNTSVSNCNGVRSSYDGLPQRLKDVRRRHM